jgi:hypothetical protein
MKWVKDLMIVKQLAKKTAKLKPREIRVPKKIKSVGILSNTQEEFYTCKEVLRSLYQYNVKILGYYFLDGEKKEGTPNEAVNHKNFSVTGQATEYFKEFKDEKFDCILIPTTSLTPYLLSLLSMTNHGFRLGFYSYDHRDHLDLMIEKKLDVSLDNQIMDLINYLYKID